ncbi:hypothetical protein OH77DRAFT_765315 [Trametes cingulata]|nr:hypothetical protein OH77DRAFT_765315 [Trametes cingulata]
MALWLPNLATTSLSPLDEPARHRLSCRAATRAVCPAAPPPNAVYPGSECSTRLPNRPLRREAPNLSFPPASRTSTYAIHRHIPHIPLPQIERTTPLVHLADARSGLLPVSPRGANAPSLYTPAHPRALSVGPYIHGNSIPMISTPGRTSRQRRIARLRCSAALGVRIAVRISFWPPGSLRCRVLAAEEGAYRSA